MIVCDASAVIASIDGSERLHASARATLDAEPGPLALSPFVCAEIDYLLLSRYGLDAELAFLGAVAEGGFRIESFSADDVGVAAEVIAQYRDLGIGLADASVVVLAERFRTRRIFTLDRRRFETLRPLQGGRFELLPVAV